jgi:hypothetical protein
MVEIGFNTPQNIGRIFQEERNAELILMETRAGNDGIG